jgi:excisionase family DNA binding protein
MLDEKFYTVADVARVTGLTSRTIRNYLKDGTLTGQKIGVQWRFTEDEVKKLFSRQTPGCSSPAQVMRSFLGQEPQENTSICTLLDVPGVTEEEGLELYRSLERECRQGISAISYEYHDDCRILRIAVSGDAGAVMDLLEQTKAGMKIA